MSNNAMNFTKLMGSVYSELDFGFENLHANEELEQYMNELINKIELNRNSGEGTIDSSVIDLYNKILRLLKSCVPELTMSEAYDLVKIRRSAQSEVGKLKKTDSNYIEELKRIHANMETQVDNCCEFISKHISTLPSMMDFDDIFMQTIADGYLSKNDQTFESNHAPASADYITRIVHRRLRKISPEFVCEKGGQTNRTDTEGYIIDDKGDRILRSDLPSTRLLILKQFIKVFGWGEGVADTDESRHGRPIQSPELKKYIDDKFNGSMKEASLNIDETVFSELKEVTHRGLLVVAQNLANGKFGYTQSVREDIYIFSIAFKMSFSVDIRPNISENDPDYETDIRKNLFFDYYCENLFNMDLDAEQPKKISKNEKGKDRSSRRKYIPGYGPNYRNYIEMIYIYFILRDDLSELEKLQNAKKLIRKCQQKGKSIEQLEEAELETLQTAIKLIKECQESGKSIKELEKAELEKLQNAIKLIKEYQKKGKSIEQLEEAELGTLQKAKKLIEKSQESGESIKELEEAEHAKLQNAKKIIKECQEKGRSIEDLEKAENDSMLCFQPTEYYRTTAFNEIKNKDEEKFKDYILENFVCKVEKTKKLEEETNSTISRMNISAAHVTAANYYSDLLMSFGKKAKDKARIEYTGEDNRLHNLLKQFDDLCENEGELRNWYLKLNNDKRFDSLLYKEDMLEYDANIVVNRTDLEVLLTDCLVVKVSELTSGRRKEILNNFKSFYDYAAREAKFEILNDLYSGISSVLSACGYQEICSKNIFDIMLIYATYKKCAVNHL